MPHRTAARVLLAPIRYLSVAFRLPGYFDADERRLIFVSIVIGALTWAIVFTLKIAVHQVSEAVFHWVNHAPSVYWLLGPLILGAIVVASIARFGASSIHYRDDSGHIHELIDVEGDGLERAIALYYSSEPALEQALLGKEGVDVRWELPTFSLVVRKYLATLVTLGSGGSGGLEAGVALIGESTAASLFKPRRGLARRPQGRLGRAWDWWQPSHTDDLQTAQLAGIGAAVSTLLGAPLAAAFFATEVMYRRRPVIEKLIYSLVAALTAFLLSNMATAGHSHIFEPETIVTPPSTPRYYTAIILLAIGVSFVSAYFSRVRSAMARFFHQGIPNIWIRHSTGAAATGVIALAAIGLTGYEPDLVLGTGEHMINLALAGQITGQVALVALVAKLFATLATIGSGGSAGLLIPSVFLGTMTGVLVAGLFDFPAVSLVVPAMTASLVAIVNVPLAAIIFTVEVFGSQYLLPSLVTLVVTLIFSHNNAIYRTQRERDEGRQVLPGYSVRRVTVPLAWDGKTLAGLGLRTRYDVNVVGKVERTSDGTRIQPQVAATDPLLAGELLVVLGEDKQLDALETRLSNT